MLDKDYQDLARNVDMMLTELRSSAPDRPLWVDIMDADDDTIRDPAFDPFSPPVSLVEYGPRGYIASYLDEVRSVLGVLWCELDEDDTSYLAEDPFPVAETKELGTVESTLAIVAKTVLVSTPRPPHTPTDISMAPISCERPLRRRGIGASIKSLASGPLPSRKEPTRPLPHRCPAGLPSSQGAA